MSDHAHPDHRRGGNDRPQTDAASRPDERDRRPRHREADACRYRQARAGGRLRGRVETASAPTLRSSGRQRSWFPENRTSFSIWRRSCRAKRRPISRRATGSTSTAPATCSRRSARRSPDRSWRPRLVFASSIAVFGTPFPEPIHDEFLTAPLTSYGTQKAMCELLLSDYSRRGFFDGIGLRLPTICVRPGAPNKAASGFFSGILREPLAGKEAVSAGRRGRAPLACEPARGRGLPVARGRHGPGAAGQPAQSHDAGPFSDGRGTDRGAAPRRRAMRR